MSLIQRLLLMGFVILFTLGSCSTRAGPQTPPLPTDTRPVEAPVTTKTQQVLTDTPALRTPTPIPTTLAPSSQSSGAIDEIVSYIEGLAAQDQFSGAILIAQGSEILWENANGLANREANIPNRVDTKFNLGSMNKMFTAVAILQLVEQNKLNLEDTIAMHLPDYPNSVAATQVTIHQLLTHSSGLGDAFTEAFESNPNQYRSNQDFLPLFVDEPLLFTPGESFIYSNAGYVLLGLVIEALSGQSYYDYVRLNIFEPSGMLSTDSYEIEENIPNLAIGYTTQDLHGVETGVLVSNTAMMPGKGFAAGGGYSTIEDLFLFQKALLGHRLLSPTATDLLITGKVEVRENSQYGYGFFDRLEAGYRVVGHGGGAPGVCSFLNMYLESGYTVVVLSNSDSDCMAVLTYLRDNPLQ